VISGGWDSTVRVWDLHQHSEQVIFEGHSGAIFALAVLPDGRVISSGWDKTVRVWDPRGQLRPMVFEGHSGVVRALAVLCDGRVVSGGDDGVVKVWSEALPLQQTSFIADTSISCLAITSTGLIAASCRDGTVHFLRPAV
jgi:WD40 repeat protein